MKMKLPCEEALWYVLPQIRSDLARELSQKEVADLLGITPSAVSQYAHKKRAGKFKTTAEYKEYIKKMAKGLKETKNKEEVSKLRCKCCTESRVKGGK